MNSRDFKSPSKSLSTRIDDESPGEFSPDAHADSSSISGSPGSFSGSDRDHDGAQLEFSAILGSIATPAPEPHDLRKFMTEYTMCAMCDTKLEIRHEINTNDLKVKEEAHCPSCGIRVRSKHHLMH